MIDDLDEAALSRSLRRRAVRTFPALVSTEAHAQAWARSGAPSGALVVADYQAAPRGRAGWPWRSEPGRGLGFSLVLRPPLPPEREGWCYLVAAVALRDVVAPADSRLEWPDVVHDPRTGARRAAVAVHADLGQPGRAWVVVTVLVEGAEPPRGDLLGRCVTGIERRFTDDEGAVLSTYRSACSTLGRDVCARMVPLGPSGVQIRGRAVDVLGDGALVVLTDRGHRVAVRPQHLGILDDVPPADAQP
ncbi:MAG: hypothetical protein M3P83_09850 [Actinomycetota bacterium]|nr:hypothetical protein [Actinomycetota bacterium]